MAQPIHQQGVDLERVKSRSPSTPYATVIVRLRDDFSDKTPKAQVARMHQNMEMQSGFMNRVARLNGHVKLIARVQRVMNAVFLEVDRKMLPALAQDPSVVRIVPVADYRLDLTETVPYIGGTVLHAAGFDGTGVRVAILDSGADYTHYNLFGSGDPNDFANNDPNVIEPGTFPTSKIVGGYDFVGGVWPNGPLAPDIPIRSISPATARTSPTSSAGVTASRRAPRSTRSRSARQSPAPAAAWR